MYVTRLGEPGPPSSVNFCGYRLDALPACEGNGTVYPKASLWLVEALLRMSSCASVAPTLSRGVTEIRHRQKSIALGEMTVTSDTTVSAANTYDGGSTPPGPLPPTGVSEHVWGWLLLVLVLMGGGILLRLCGRQQRV